MQIKNEKSCARSMTDEDLVRAVRRGLQPSFHQCLAGKEDMLVQLFAMMFCSFCGEKCATAAIFCHKCGKMITLSVDKENGSPSDVHCVQKTSATASKPLLTFAAF